MRVLLTGATGFIGSAILMRLIAEGHQVVGVTRRGGSIARRVHADRWVVLDMIKATTSEAWRPHLEGIEAVVNCAGVLQDGAGDSARGVHVAGAAALFAAAEAAGVRRVVQISAIGVETDGPTAFSRTKAEGDRDLMARDLDWTVLKPSVVVGRSAYGGSALFRGLAALPWLPAVKEPGRLQVVQVDELTETVAFFLRPEAPSRLALDVAGPERLTFDDVVATYRRWLGFEATWTVPGFLTPLAFRIGDLLGSLGWRPPIRSTARRELLRGAVGDNAEWKRITGIEPRTLRSALMAEPASVQERWFANLYLLKGLVLAVLAGFWLVTALVALGPGHDAARETMLRTSLGQLGGPAVVAGALADLAVGLAICRRATARLGLLGALGLSLLYLVAGTILQPSLWADPLGPLVKILPIVALNLVALAILEDR